MATCVAGTSSAFLGILPMRDQLLEGLNGILLARTCNFSPETARDFMLLHVLLHELDHHHDRLTTRSRCRSARGENYAESYANTQGELIWERYCKEFKT